MLKESGNSGTSGQDGEVGISQGAMPYPKDAVFQQAERLGIGIRHDPALGMYFVSGVKEKIAQFFKAIREDSGEQLAAAMQVAIDMTLNVRADDPDEDIEYTVTKAVVSEREATDDPPAFPAKVGSGSSFLTHEWMKHGIDHDVPTIAPWTPQNFSLKSNQYVMNNCVLPISC
jgi:hypothetical protein